MTDKTKFGSPVQAILLRGSTQAATMSLEVQVYSLFIAGVETPIYCLLFWMTEGASLQYLPRGVASVGGDSIIRLREAKFSA